MGKKVQTGQVKGRGFTLIELLVVVSIIALLVSILLPSLNKAREMAKRTVCLSSLKSIGLVMHMYADDHEGVFVTCKWQIPYIFSVATGGSFGAAAYWKAGYLEQGGSTLYCVKDKQRENAVGWMGGYTARPFPYYAGYNGNWEAPTQFVKKVRIDNVPNPYYTIAYSDKMYTIETIYHKEGWNAVFIDGHAEWVMDSGSYMRNGLFITLEPILGGMATVDAYRELEMLAGNCSPDFLP